MIPKKLFLTSLFRYKTDKRQICDHPWFVASKLLGIMKEAFSLSSTLKKKVLRLNANKQKTSPARLAAVKCEGVAVVPVLTINYRDEKGKLGNRVQNTE